MDFKLVKKQMDKVENNLAELDEADLETLQIETQKFLKVLKQLVKKDTSS